MEKFESPKSLSHGNFSRKTFGSQITESWKSFMENFESRKTFTENFESQKTLSHGK